MRHSRLPGGGRVLWINGAFGSGKTTTARLVVDSVPGAVLVDPEEIGSLLRPVLQTVAPVRDFQEWGAWRDLVASTINAVVRELPSDGPRLAVIPQTVTCEGYWSQIRGALDSGIDVTAVALHVDSAEHSRRVTGDQDEPDAVRWRLGGYERFRAASWIHEEFIRIETSGVEPDGVAGHVRAALVGA